MPSAMSEMKHARPRIDHAHGHSTVSRNGRSSGLVGLRPSLSAIGRLQFLRSATKRAAARSTSPLAPKIDSAASARASRSRTRCLAPSMPSWVTKVVLPSSPHRRRSACRAPRHRPRRRADRRRSGRLRRAHGRNRRAPGIPLARTGRGSRRRCSHSATARRSSSAAAARRRPARGRRSGLRRRDRASGRRPCRRFPSQRASARVSSRRTPASLWISSRVMMSNASVSKRVAGQDRGGVVIGLVQRRHGRGADRCCPSPADRHGSANSSGCIRVPRTGQQRRVARHAEHRRALDHQKRPQPLAAAEARIPHGVEQPLRACDLVGQQRHVRQQFGPSSASVSSAVLSRRFAKFW